MTHLYQVVSCLGDMTAVVWGRSMKVNSGEVEISRSIDRRFEIGDESMGDRFLKVDESGVVMMESRGCDVEVVM